MTTTNRRNFLKTATAAGAGMMIAPQISKASDSKQKQINGEVNIAFIGCGGRGRGHLKRAAMTEGVKITAFCDIDPEAVEKTQQVLKDQGHPEAEVYSDGEHAYLDMLKRDDIDGVLIATPWLWHTRMAVATMKAGKYVAVEVSAANTMEECWDLVNTSEETGMPCMILENVNYRRDVMAVMNMVKQGIFGEVVHARCGYRHSLLNVKFNRDLKFGEGSTGEARWRTQHSLKRNADVYPTHGLG
ncbi:MAG: Gfo/Idh/MocA family oxidoreductase, partial [Bacteroidetes bacterium]|nr:Gfo/Idh/MocA family oxidoreductase [Bacteroidota bacterium]